MSEMFKAYFAALKPERTFFNVMMTAAAFVYACGWHIHWLLAVATIGGTSLLVMSGCLANNATDARLDASMPRTHKRASATGEISVRSLAVLALLLGVVGFVVLLVWVNWLTALLGVAAYVDYVLLYAWTKRTTPWSTLAGTPAGALPLVAGYTAVSDRFDAIAVALALVMVFWQMAHFYAIGIYRLTDYKAGGLPIWPARYGAKSTQRRILAYIVLYLLAIDGLTAVGNMGVVFWGLEAVGLVWLGLGIKNFYKLSPEAWARRMFSVSLITLLLLAAGIVISPLLP